MKREKSDRRIHLSAPGYTNLCPCLLTLYIPDRILQIIPILLENPADAAALAHQVMLAGLGTARFPLENRVSS